MADLRDLTDAVLALVDDGRGVIVSLPGMTPDREAAATVLERSKQWRVPSMSG